MKIQSTVLESQFSGDAIAPPPGCQFLSNVLRRAMHSAHVCTDSLNFSVLIYFSNPSLARPSPDWSHRRSHPPPCTRHVQPTCKSGRPEPSGPERPLGVALRTRFGHASVALRTYLVIALRSHCARIPSAHSARAPIARRAPARHRAGTVVGTPSTRCCPPRRRRACRPRGRSSWPCPCCCRPTGSCRRCRSARPQRCPPRTGRG